MRKDPYWQDWPCIRTGSNSHSIMKCLNWKQKSPKTCARSYSSFANGKAKEISLIFINDPVLHHEPYPSHTIYIFRRIAVYGYDIGQFVFFNNTEAIITQQVGC